MQGIGGFSTQPRQGSETVMCARMEFFPLYEFENAKSNMTEFKGIKGRWCSRA
jgi:hypothetical protein